MKTFNFKVLTLAICTGAALTLTACGSDNSDDVKPQPQQSAAQTETIKGMAATGKAFAGKVIVKNKDGKESNAVDIKADGSFEVTAPKGAPYLIKAYNDKTGDQATVLYSYAADTKATVNVNQLTTQALFSANDQADLAKLYGDWVKQSVAINQTAIEEAAKKVAANLQAQFATVNIDATKLNIFNYSFKPDGKGFDAVLDKVQISGFNNCNVTSCNVKYTVNGTDYSWNYGISTNGYSWVIDNGNGGGLGGNYNLKVTTSVSGFGTSVEIKGVEKPTNQQEFCGDVSVTEQLPQGYKLNSCSFNGNTGNIAATISANGINVSYSVKYEYTAI